MELKKEIESLLFSSGKMMAEQELASLTNKPLKEVKEALESLRKDYEERDTSLMLVQNGDNWKLNVREKYIGLVTKVVADTELPFPVISTLSVIAHKHPAMQADIIKTRGTNAYEHIGVLVEQGFVEKRKEGRSFKLILTPKFFEYFDVPDHEAIKESFKDVKMPEPKPAEPQDGQQPEESKLGKLDVVDLPPEAIQKEEEERQKKLLGDLEVVDAPEPKVNIDNNRPDHTFLKDIDERIDQLSQRNDDLDDDTSFKRQEELDKEIQDIMKESGLEPEEGPDSSDKKKDVFGEKEEEKEGKENKEGSDEEKKD
ncbi:SMC-Scp complex subunit ScpB [Candidatus Woesearchaeota archaeon]|nr:SMC-Scp complex subunit ScpB [Candidatus Woesearchaeota archaeon]